MVKDCKSVWNACISYLRERVGEQSFQTWFRPIVPLRLEGEVLTIQVPSQFFYEWLEEHYVHLLREALQRELGMGAKLEYSVIIDQGNAQQHPFSVQIPTGGSARNNAIPEIAKSTSNPAVSLQEAPPPPWLTTLRSNYTFETFIEGDCNRLARSAGIAVAGKPGITSFNPLMIYSGVGLGKTHLVQAIGNRLRENHPDKLCLYVSADRFANLIIDAFKSNSLQEFAGYFMQVDVLIMDDVHILAGKEKTQDIFFHIFNHLHQAGKQLILTSDCPPKELQGLQERLISRFKWGLTADVQAPDYETRMAIIYKKLEADGIRVPDKVVEYLAYHVDTSVRDLEGVIVSLIGHASLNRREIDLDLAKQTLENIVSDSARDVTIDFVQKFVSDYYDVSIDLMKAKTRKREVVVARQVAMYFAKEYTNLSLKAIGYHFGNRDHSTVIHAINTVGDMMDTDRRFLSSIQELQRRLKLKAG